MAFTIERLQQANSETPLRIQMTRSAPEKLQLNHRNAIG
jgi:hypothetical protein